MPRFFTLDRAEKLLPEVEPQLRDALALKAEYLDAEAEAEAFCRRVSVLGGVSADPAELLDKKQRREATAHRLRKSIEKIQEQGCLLKDLDRGLLGFSHDAKRRGSLFVLEAR